MDGNIDMIITKSISRFARNALDCLKYIRELKEVDFLNKKRVQNKGIVPPYYVENNHETIIPRDIYIQVQESDLQAINLTLDNRENMMVTLQENMEAVIRQEDEISSEGIESKLLELQKELLKLTNSKKIITALQMRLTGCGN